MKFTENEKTVLEKYLKHCERKIQNTKVDKEKVKFKITFQTLREELYAIEAEDEENLQDEPPVVIGNVDSDINIESKKRKLNQNIESNNDNSINLETTQSDIVQLPITEPTHDDHQTLTDHEVHPSINPRHKTLGKNKKNEDKQIINQEPTIKPKSENDEDNENEVNEEDNENEVNEEDNENEVNEEDNENEVNEEDNEEVDDAKDKEPNNQEEDNEEDNEVDSKEDNEIEKKPTKPKMCRKCKRLVKGNHKITWTCL